MYSTPITPGDAVGVSDDCVVYRVRAWTPPPAPGFAWMVDEWDVYDAPNIISLLEWTTAHTSNGQFEIFVHWTDHAETRDGTWSPRKRYTRVYGEPADDGGTSETVSFTEAQ